MLWRAGSQTMHGLAGCSHLFSCLSCVSLRVFARLRPSLLICLFWIVAPLRPLPLSKVFFVILVPSWLATLSISPYDVSK